MTEIGEIEAIVEGTIFREKGQTTWTALFEDIQQAGRIMRCRVDFCPWCGKRLEEIGEHSH